MRLYELLIQSANSALELQNENGSFPEGHNGPWNDPDTPVRNTANWLKLFLFVYEKTGDNCFLIAVKKALNYLLSEEARPHNATFICRTNPERNQSNGLIGQAWVLEALIYAYKTFKEPGILQVIRDVFLLHEFDGKNGLWSEMNPDGSAGRIMAIFNQQLWFAAMGSLIMNEDAEIKKRSQMFLDNLESNFCVYSSGMIKHRLLLKNGFHGYCRNMLSNIKSRKQILRLSSGYHSFNLYAFAILKESYPDSSFWETWKCLKAINFTKTREFEESIENNKYGFGYNATGIEIACVLNVFQKNSKDLQKCWLGKQFQRNYDLRKKMLCKNTQDAETLSARIYEAARLPDIDIDINS